MDFTFSRIRVWSLPFGDRPDSGRVSVSSPKPEDTRNPTQCNRVKPAGIQCVLQASLCLAAKRCIQKRVCASLGCYKFSHGFWCLIIQHALQQARLLYFFLRQKIHCQPYEISQSCLPQHYAHSNENHCIEKKLQC